jgi:hypothetical protein
MKYVALIIILSLLLGCGGIIHKSCSSILREKIYMDFETDPGDIRFYGEKSL